MKFILALIPSLTISFSVFAASHIGNGPGLAELGLSQFECTTDVQQISPKSGAMGEKGTLYRIVLASDAKSASAATLNKLDFYGPVEGALFYLAADGRQFKVNGIRCH